MLTMADVFAPILLPKLRRGGKAKHLAKLHQLPRDFVRSIAERHGVKLTQGGRPRTRDSPAHFREHFDRVRGYAGA